MRTLPWTYPSITQQTSALDVSALAPSDVDKNLRNVDNVLTGLILFEVITGFGTSTANLRALGSANTLVLINGRRVAGRAGDEEGFANLLRTCRFRPLNGLTFSWTVARRCTAPTPLAA